jgi:hypothetical protein
MHKDVLNVVLKVEDDKKALRINAVWKQGVNS